MEKITHYNSITELHEKSGFEPPNHPLISLMTCKELLEYSVGKSRFTGDFYMIGLKKIESGCVQNYKTKDENGNASMVFVKPRQIFELTNIQLAQNGCVMLFHESYLFGNMLHNQIKKYGYFEFEINEALHISSTEEDIILELYEKIKNEHNNNADEFSREIILSHIDSILKYSDRFYKRQFTDRCVNISGNMAKKFQNALEDYFIGGLHLTLGIPNVNHLASELHLSTRYLSDVLKQQTGKTALNHIQAHLIKEAKNQLVISENNVAGIAYDLGFESPSYFSRLFKKVVGVSPMKYKEQSRL